MMAMEFMKLQGLGNDFLIVKVEDVRELRGEGELSQTLCERNFGAGADGVVFVSPSSQDDSDFASRIFNADGSEAEISGNGTRCAAAFIYYREIWSEPEIRIATAAGVKRGRLIDREGTHFEFQFDMGEPVLKSSDLPMSLPEPLERVVRYPLNLGDEELEVTCVSMGNPHCTVFVSDLDRIDISEMGPLIEGQRVFPNRTNVEFVRVLSSEEIEVRFWERGVGQTLSSGTGSCASGVAAMLNGLTGRSVRVHTAGGILQVEWQHDNHVALTGPAEVIYEGRWLRD
ncbi:MAG: diaminopimelate epimerase [Blastocatellia bacterium]|nr:diaminopimelate epimerase [Blastocatellia bacterium]